jgi:thymidylate synthase (FAD)
MMVSIDDAYQLLKENGIPKDDARYVLPGAAANHLYAKFNLREILGPIMTQRLCKRNTPEMLYNMQQMIHLMCLAGFENCVIMGGCSCVVGGGCDQGRMSCKKPYNSWEEMIYGN